MIAKHIFFSCCQPVAFTVRTNNFVHSGAERLAINPPGLSHQHPRWVSSLSDRASINTDKPLYFTASTIYFSSLFRRSPFLVRVLETQIQHYLPRYWPYPATFLLRVEGIPRKMAKGRRVVILKENFTVRSYWTPVLEVIYKLYFSSTLKSRQGTAG